MIKVAEIVEEYKKGNVSKATMIKMAAFKAELEKMGSPFFESISKGLKEFGPDISKGLVYGGVATAAGAGVMGLGSLIHMGIQAMESAWEEHKLPAHMEEMFEKVLVDHPELKETPEKESLARKYFEALHHFSPSMADSPLAAGAYIKQALQMHHVAGGPLPEMVEKATLVQKNLADIHDKSKSEYTTPLGAVFLPFKPQAGKLPMDYRPQSVERSKTVSPATPDYPLMSHI
jgi:hypothetical protein